MIIPKGIVRRWALGLPLDGDLKTDATFFRRGAFISGKRGTKWATRSYFRVAITRWFIALVLLSYALLFIRHRQATIAVTVGFFICAFAAGMVVLYLVYSRRRHVKTLVEPFAHRLGPAIGHSEGTTAQYQTWLKFPQNYRSSGITIQPAKDFYADENLRDAIDDMINSTIMGEWKVKFNQRGRPLIVVTPMVPPPNEVPFTSLEKDIRAADPWHPVIAMGYDREVIPLDFKYASCVGVSMPRGSGKSVLIRALIMQWIPWDWRVILFDDKLISQKWANGLIEIYSEAKEWAQVIPELLAEMRKRYEILAHNPNAHFQPIAMVFEEMNAYNEMSRIMWRGMDWEGGGKRPSIPPWITDTNILIWESREANFVCFVVGQRLSVYAMGGSGDMRENFLQRLGARYTKQTAIMLFGETKMPILPRIAGRMAMAYNGDAAAREIQIVNVTEEQAKKYAQEKRITVTRVTSTQEPLYGDTTFTDAGTDDTIEEGIPYGDSAGTERGQRGDTLTHAGTLREAAEYVGIPYDTMKRRLNRARTKGTPVPAFSKRGNSHVYDLDELKEWMTHNA